MSGQDTAGRLPLIRELFAGVIAVVFTATFLLLVYSAYQSRTDASSFGVIKELITIVNGIVGIIVGYYFSRMTTEARAESAEATAAKATDTAGAATAAAASATAREREATGQLTRLTGAVKEVLPTDPGGTQAKGVTASVAPDPAAAARLRDAIREAERALGL